MSAPPGWYRDPREPDHPRYWDGQQWAQLAPKQPPPPTEPPLPDEEPARPAVPAPQRRNRSKIIVAGLITIAVIALIAIGAAVQSLSGGGHHSSPTTSTTPTTGFPTSPQ